MLYTGEPGMTCPKTFVPINYVDLIIILKLYKGT